MQFSLWGPKNKDAIVRIYINNTDAYIWRKSKNDVLRISDASYHFEMEIYSFLISNGIDINEIGTRRELARTLYLRGLLNGNVSKYYSTLKSRETFPSRAEIVSTMPNQTIVSSKDNRRTSKSLSNQKSNVVSLADFRKNR